MIDLSDIQSFTEFQRTARDSIKRLKKTGRPAILTINGQAEVVVQDAKSYQRLLARVEEADRLMALQRSISEYRAGQFRDIDDALDMLEARHAGPARRSPTK